MRCCLAYQSGFSAVCCVVFSDESNSSSVILHSYVALVLPLPRLQSTILNVSIVECVCVY